MAPFGPIVVRLAIGAIAGYAAKEAVEAYNRRQRQKEAERALEILEEAKRYHRDELESVVEEFGEQLDEFSRRRLERMIESLG